MKYANNAPDIILHEKLEKNRPTPIQTSLDTPATASSTPTSTAKISVFEHINADRNNSTLYEEQGNSCKLPCRSPLLCFLVAYGILVTGAGTFFFNRFLGIPDLNGQIDKLKTEVDRLEGEVDELRGHIDELDETTATLESTIVELNGENNKTKDLMRFLNISLGEYTSLNTELEKENAEYEENNVKLDETIRSLEETVGRLSIERVILNNTAMEYKTLNEALEVEVNELTSLTGELNGTIKDLDEAIDEFKHQNEMFRERNEDLSTLVIYLNDTVTGSTATFTELVGIVADDIRRSKVLVRNQLKYMLITLSSQNWVCTVETIFGMEAFMVNSTLPIGEALYPAVIDNIYDNTLRYWCVDLLDFEDFIQTAVLIPNETDTWRISISDLIAAVQVYTFDVYEYYFKRPTEGGLTDDLWDEFDYDCENIPHDLKYRHGPTLEMP